MRVPMLGRVGFGLVVAAVALFFGSRHWLETRSLVPLETEITLAKGHFSSPEFDIDYGSGYYVGIAADDIYDVYIGNQRTSAVCLLQGCYSTPAILNLHWTLFRNGRIVASGNSSDINGSSGFGNAGRYIGHFAVPSGRYKFEIDVLSDATVLNTAYPTLKVVADGDAHNRISDLYEKSFLVCCVMVIVGVFLRIRSNIKQHVSQSTPTDIPAGSVNAFGEQVSKQRRTMRRNLLSGMPTFGLIGSLVILPLLVLFMSLSPLTPHGIYVSIDPEKYAQSNKQPELQPIVVSVDKKGKFYLNSHGIDREELGSALKREFATRAQWIVYVDVNENMPYMDATYVVDVVAGLHGRSVLLTPSMRISSHN